MLKRQKRKWRLALTAIYCTRALASLYKEVVHDKNAPLLRSLSYIAIDMEPNKEEDEKKLLANTIDIVKEKNPDHFMSQLRRVKELAAAKGFLSFVFEAFKDAATLIFLVSALLTLVFGIKLHGLKDGWYDGGGIIFAVLFVVVVSAVSNFKLSPRASRRGFDDNLTNVQTRLNKLTSCIGKVGLAVDLLVLAVYVIHYFTGNSRDKYGDVMNNVVAIVAAVITTVVVAVPEGLPLAVTLTTLANYSMHKTMMNDNVLVRKLSACETMGLATTICTDRQGTLTLNEMKVIECWLGNEAITQETNLSEIATTILQLLQQAVGLSTTGSPTDQKAILSWAVFDLGMKNMEELKQGCMIIQEETFDSHKNRSGVLMRRKSEKAIQTHWNGDAETILSMCSNYYDKTGTARAINDEERMHVGSIVQKMLAKGMRCIAFAHKKLQQENGQEEDDPHEKLEEGGLTLLGLVGLKHLCRPEVTTEVDACGAAGVVIKMITGDDVDTARAIAADCGILKPNIDQDLDQNRDAVVEGEQFRSYSTEERMEKVDKIHVIARSTPFDKLLMVQCLKEKGHVVVVTGDGTNDDALALKETDVGISMGVRLSNEVETVSSDIVILDGTFTSVVEVMRWGRCVHANTQKFLQFQLTISAAALVVNFIAAVFSGKVVLTAFQLLWVNLI
ncbi:calcium-transporting ATPase 12 plasma membrane-type-like [Prunus yedoensis var. nudiflora]|uniref:Calcium-transporting ATPase 12 plasma membrane-type-like n=1 Tax=Prunus yedoensis var. nudiflora TaxID=2094558 RepID=A0A314Z336_PRUYE|nr:calcium-transporting ATPase 12 plasma membrane-type-like [Prunus yedoensis var. nudiflora]